MPDTQLAAAYMTDVSSRLGKYIPMEFTGVTDIH